MAHITSQTLYEVIKELCFRANVILPKAEYNALVELYEQEVDENAKITLKQILTNAKIAYETKRPLCQDTGFVTVFLEIGNKIQFDDESIETVIQNAVKDAYKDFYFRKSIVNEPLIDRMNNGQNIPALIHTEFVEGDELKITVSPKGGGCENISALQMLKPADGLQGVKEFIIQTIKSAGSKPCPPIRIGVGIGSNFEGAAILSKKALLQPITKSDLPEFANELLNEINALEIGAMGLGGNSTCFAVNILQKPCHIASLPVALSVACHSSRHASAKISANTISYQDDICNFYDFADDESAVVNLPEILTSDIEKIRALKSGEKIFLTGKIYTARDAAHKKLCELLKNNSTLPIDIKNAIIFYAGPCPASNEEIIGPIGPTTSARMDVYAPVLYKNGLLATIGKGERSQEVIESIEDNNAKYFTITGGVAALLKSCVKSAKVVAYPELGPEAIYELEVEKLPLFVK